LGRILYVATLTSPTQPQPPKIYHKFLPKETQIRRKEMKPTSIKAELNVRECNVINLTINGNKY
jgi:hypothetical protein